MNDGRLTGLDLFSGIGGLTLALSKWVCPAAYCEIDVYAAGVLFSRMLDGSLPAAPVFPDIRHIAAEILPRIDMVYGGFPCQDISNAGPRVGVCGERSGLFFELWRIVCELRPRYVFLENVPGILNRGFSTILSTMAESGYDCRYTVLSAAEVGAPHQRKRWWALCTDTKRMGCTKGPVEVDSGCKGEKPANHVGIVGKAQPTSEGSQYGWKVEPELGRMVDGIPAGMDRIRSLGNAVVPKCAETAFVSLMLKIGNNGYENP